VTKLVEFAPSQPHACYAAFTFGLKHCWTYFLRTLPDREDLLAPLERAIADALIPSITGHNCTQAGRTLLARPVRMGGMGLTNPRKSLEPPEALEPPEENEVHAVQREMRQVKNQYLKQKLDEVNGSISGKNF